MVFSSWGADSFGGEGGKTQFADYNFNSYVDPLILKIPH